MVVIILSQVFFLSNDDSGTVAGLEAVANFCTKEILRVVPISLTVWYSDSKEYTHNTQTAFIHHYSFAL